MIDYIVIGCWVAFAVVWIVAAFFVKRAQERQSLASRMALVLPALVVAVAIGFFPGGFLRKEVLPSWTRIFAVPLAVLGVAFAFWARYTLGRNWSSWVTFKKDHELIQTGPYRFVRHPIYGGLLTLFIATALASGRLMFFIAMAIGAGALMVKMRQVETLMTQHFPETYPAYKQRTKRLIPFVL